MVFENFGVLNRVRVRKVQRHVPIITRVPWLPSPGHTIFQSETQRGCKLESAKSTHGWDTASDFNRILENDNFNLIISFLWITKLFVSSLKTFLVIRQGRCGFRRSFFTDIPILFSNFLNPSMWLHLSIILFLYFISCGFNICVFIFMLLLIECNNGIIEPSFLVQISAWAQLINCILHIPLPTSPGMYLGFNLACVVAGRRKGNERKSFVLAQSLDGTATKATSIANHSNINTKRKVGAQFHAPTKWLRKVTSV